MKNELYIIDDHTMVRSGLKNWLEQNTDWKVPFVFSSSEECLEHLASIKALSKQKSEAENLYPEIIIIDIQLVQETGFVLLKKITSEYKSIKCVMYSMYDTSGYILQARDYGAKGYISKVASEQEMAECLEVVKNGGSYLEDKMKASLIKVDNIVSMLTKSEKAILEYLLQEKTNEQISEIMFISVRTVENYVSRLYDKLDVKNRAQLMERYGG